MSTLQVNRIIPLSGSSVYIQGAVIDSASFAATSATASYVNTLYQNVIVTGSLEVSGALTGDVVTAHTLVTSITGSFGRSAASKHIVTTNSELSGSTFITGSLLYNGDTLVTGTQFTAYSSSVSSSIAALSGSLSGNYLPLSGGTITGNLVVNGTASITYLNTVFESASVIYSSGSNVFGDAINDIQTLYGTVDLKNGPLQVTGSLNVAYGITGTLTGTASHAIYADNAGNANTAISAPYYVLTASYNADSSSVSTRVTNLESWSSSLDTGFVTEAELNAATASLQAGVTASIAGFATTGSNTFIGNQIISKSNAEIVLRGGGSYGTINFHDFNASIFDYVGQNQLRLQALNQISTKTNNFTVLDSSDNVKVNITGSLIQLSGSVSALSGFTGSLEGTASYAISSSYAATASYAISATVFPYTGSAIISGSLEVTGSTTITGSLDVAGNTTITGSLTTAGATQMSGSLNVTGSTILSGSLQVTGSQTITGSFDVAGPVTMTGSLTIAAAAQISGSLNVTGSTILSGSLQVTGSQTITGSFDVAGNITTTGSLTTAGAVQISGSLNVTGSTILSGSLQTTGSQTITGSLDVAGNTTMTGSLIAAGAVGITGSLGVTGSSSVTGSFTVEGTQSITGSIAITGSNGAIYVDAIYPGSGPAANRIFTQNTDAGFGPIGATVLYTSAVPLVLNAAAGTQAVQVTGSLVLSNGATGSLLGTASFADTASTVITAPSYVATTGSNTFTGTQYISDTTNATSFTSTAALYTDGGLRVKEDGYVSGNFYVGGDLTIYGTASVNYVTTSVFVGLEFIDLNTDLPALRYAGINVGDSGSAAGISSSFWYDSQNNDWVFVHSHEGSAQTSSIAMFGPIAYNNVGNEVGITGNYLAKGQAVDGAEHDHHITSSQVYDDGTTVRIAGNLQVTGSLYAGNLTGSLNGSNLVVGSVGNDRLTNSTISGIALGSNLGTLTIGTGLSGTSYNGSTGVTIANTGVTSIVAGTAISISGGTGAVTVNNTGVTSAVAGTGVGVSGATGAVTISIGQAVATSSNVQFNSLGVGTAGSGTAGEIRATADVTAYYSSDERLKENVTPIENPIEKLMAINGVTFDWKEGFEEVHSHKGTDTGVIAQEIEAIGLPDTVTTRENGYKAVRYEKLNALLIEGFKVQQTLIHSQQAQIDELKTLVNQLLNK